MGQFPQDRENGQNVTFFEALLLPNSSTFQLFSTVLKRFCPLHSKNVFVLVLAHLEVDEIGDDGDDDLWHHYLSNFKQL